MVRLNQGRVAPRPGLDLLWFYFDALLSFVALGRFNFIQKYNSGTGWKT